MKNLLARLDWSYFYALLGEGTLALTFVLYIILARELGPERYEIFAAAAALGAIFSLFIQFGLPTLITREVAANPESGPTSTVKFLLLEAVNTLPVLVILWPIAHFLGFQGEGMTVCYLVILAEFCRGVKMTQRGVLKGMGWFRTETISVAIERSAVVVLAVAVLLLTKNLVWVVATLVLVRLLENLGLLYYLSRKVSVWRAFNLSNLWESCRMAYPFAISGVLWILYYQIDLVMLKGIAEVGEAGFYSAAYRIMEMFSALPRVVFYVIFTRLARYHATDPSQLPAQIYKATRVLVALVFPVLLVAGFLQTILVSIIYGDAYSYSVQSLAILIPSASIQMFGVLAQKFLEATEREKYLPPILLITTTINILSNAILIPSLGAVGAALATLLSEAVLCFIGLFVMSRMGYKRVGKQIGAIALITLIATSIPSLMLNGALETFVGIGLVGLSLGSLAFLMRPSQFLAD